MPAKPKFALDKNKLEKLYVEENKSTYDIAKIIGCSRVTVSNMIKRLGMRVKQKNGKLQSPFFINDDFFSKWSHSMAYCLGYISADGCVRPKKYELTIKSIDHEMLDFVKNTLKTNYEIKQEKNTNCYVFAVYSKKIIEDLARLGVGPRKSLTIEFPDIPDKYFWSYMRGLIDGDGHIHPLDARYAKVQINGNHIFLAKMLKILGDKIGCPFYCINPQGKSAAIAIGGVYAYKIMELVYKNNMYGLSRKKKVALKWLERKNDKEN